MKHLADGVYLLRGFPPNAINVYLIGDVILDAATRFAGRRILRQIKGHKVAAHALTHAHPDHQGASHELCQTLGIPLWCGAGDVAAMQTRGGVAASQPANPVNTLLDRLWTGPPHPVHRVLREGDVIEGFTVLDAPGHSPGHVAYWRESDRVLLLGDVLNNMNLLTLIPGLHEPPTAFSANPAENRRSARRLAELAPELVCFGHGPPLRDPEGLRAFAAGLAAD